MSSSNDTPSLFVTPQTPPRQQQRRKSNTGAISTPVASSVLLTPSTTTKNLQELQYHRKENKVYSCLHHRQTNSLYSNHPSKITMQDKKEFGFIH